MMRISTLLFVLFSCLAFVLESHAGQEPKFTKFNVPHAGRGAGQGTIPIGIVNGDWIMGSYIDRKGVSHGFLRSPDGTITEFDAPGAGTQPGQGTIEVHGMNSALEIVGTVQGADNVYHGFVRSPSGKFTTFDCPGAGTGSYLGTAAHSVSGAGLISAEYVDDNNVWHGCVRDRHGKVTVYDPPDIGTVPGSNQGTYPAIFSGINPEGAIIGEYMDTNYTYHAYLRAADGTITEFDDPNAGTQALQGSGTSGINRAGEINGWYIDPNNVFHGYLRTPDSTMTEYDVPGSGSRTVEHQLLIVFFST
jgi:hypothetical protein